MHMFRLTPVLFGVLGTLSVFLLACANARSTTTHPMAIVKSRMLFCATGSIAITPFHPPPGFESQFAVAVVELHSPTKVANAAVSGFVVFDQAGKVTRLKRVVKVEKFNDYSVTTANWRFAHYLDSPKTSPWDGTLRTGRMRLRVRVALVDEPGGVAGRCRLSVGPYTIEGPLNGSWPS